MSQSTGDIVTGLSSGHVVVSSLLSSMSSVTVVMSVVLAAGLPSASGGASAGPEVMLSLCGSPGMAGGGLVSVAGVKTCFSGLVNLTRGTQGFPEQMFRLGENWRHCSGADGPSRRCQVPYGPALHWLPV